MRKGRGDFKKLRESGGVRKGRGGFLSLEREGE